MFNNINEIRRIYHMENTEKEIGLFVKRDN